MYNCCVLTILLYFTKISPVFFSGGISGFDVIGNMDRSGEKVALVNVAIDYLLLGDTVYITLWSF